MIGRRLMKDLLDAGHNVRVLSRHAGTNLPAGVGLVVWDPMKGPPREDGLLGADVVVHLAGEPVAQRWTDDVKRRIRESRVTGTRHLVQALAALDRRPQVLISASAVGYYGSRGDEVLRESSAAGDGWLAGVCTDWEREAETATGLGVRVVKVRTGIVLDPKGGALEKMLRPFRMGVGGRLGSGRQWMPWIHIADLGALFRFVIENPVDGAVNGVAPQPVTNADFTRELGEALHRPAVFPVPMLAIRALYGEMADVLLASQRVIPVAAETAGFGFRYPQLASALADLL